MERTRRRVLATVGLLAGTAGCTGLPFENRASGGDGADAPNVATDPTPTPTGTPTATPEPGPERPEPTYVVAADGSGDYASVAEAARVAEDGDVLELKAGDYVWKPSVNRSGTSFDSYGTRLTFLGAGSGETTLSVEPDDTESDLSANEARFFDAESYFEVGLKHPSFFDMTVTWPDSLLFIATEGGDARLVFKNCTVSGQLLKNYLAVGSEFTARSSPTGLLRGCTVRAAFALGDHAFCEGCVFETPVRNGGIYDEGSAGLRRCELRQGVTGPPVAEGSSIGTRVHQCVVDAGSDEVAVDMTGYGGQFRFNEIRGQVEQASGEWIGNRFTTGGASFDYFIDGSGPGLVWGNLFEGADVRFDGSVTAYKESAGVGNYYSEWDGGEDEDDDGISDLPRPIPGEGGVTDQYPLLAADLERYGVTPES